ncbi:Glycosyl transferase (plasmid) [Rhodospirillum rubrum ATCC 11170]|uniref:Glycosyl transferase n=1 Tax=Rhodospirillum rubrum (strain ATCC 11170 / ATH 1.1.1 / DSM 467 / LMG 4362 / NCIMB 8255 / S1) TaxID=269796 RepID=Q2RMP4_RHORT|nr:glycosyltransferase [Rhodospirillum rubrum]ABC24601.1 Glycosyl transferase [Rhodospirillum rubrum ATCC 11170]QXG82511.1 glycosyltransferase [Rhodospirillum rubrum]
MQSPPLVSVVMPVYNHERYVGEAIDSVFSQTYRPIELIIIDDGSTDKSAETVRQHLAAKPAPEGIIVDFVSRPNKGAHTTINEGLAKSSGSYLAILNSDDAYMPKRLARCIATAQEHEARMIFTYVEPIGDDGVDLDVGHPWRHWYADVMLNELDISPNISSLLLQYNIGVSTGNFLFHRSLFEEVGPFHDFRYTHDIDFLLRASLIEEPVLVRERLYRYRLHGHNTISENDRKISEEYQEIVLRYFRETLIKRPANIFAPSFDNWVFSMVGSPWLPHMARAIEQLLKTPEAALSAPTETKQPVLPGLDGRHVTLVSHELSYTGAPVLLRDVALALRREGVSSNVISLSSGPLAKEFIEAGCQVTTEGRLPAFLSRLSRVSERFSHNGRFPAVFRKLFGKMSWLSGGISHRLRLRDYVKTIKGPVLINSFASWPIALGLLEKRQGPAFWYIHETYDPRMLMRGLAHYRRLRALVDGGAVTLLFGSEATRSVWAEAGFDGLVRYWSGLDPMPKSTLPTKKAKRVVLSVQASGTRKGTRVLLEAFAFARREGLIGDDVELRIIGCHAPSWNYLSRDLIRRICEPDLIGAVRLIGSLEPAMLEAHYQEADVYVQSSIMECLPLALLTAMAHSLPIVCSDADGCREAILDERTGRLVPPRQVKKMGYALADLLGDRAKANKLGMAAGAHFAENFALRVTVPKLLDTLFTERS